MSGLLDSLGLGLRVPETGCDVGRVEGIGFLIRFDAADLVERFTQRKYPDTTRLESAERLDQVSHIVGLLFRHPIEQIRREAVDP